MWWLIKIELKVYQGDLKLYLENNAIKYGASSNASFTRYKNNVLDRT